MLADVNNYELSTWSVWLLHISHTLLVILCISTGAVRLVNRTQALCKPQEKQLKFVVYIDCIRGGCKIMG
jgi:hypothetical protein